VVYTVTFNPALDYVVGVKDFQPGGLNRTAYETIQFGGKGINVSTVLHNLGIENTALGFLAGFTGRALDEGLRASGLRTDFIWLEEGLTRINVKIKAEEEGEINGRGPAIPDAAVGELFRKLDRLTAGDALVLAGSIPDSLPDDIYQQVLRRLEGKGVLTAVDAARDLLCATLPYRPFLIKPNVFELGGIFGRTPAGDGEIRACAQELQKRGARNVLVSMGRQGAFLLTEEQELYFANACIGQVRNTVGAGDSLVAGFLTGLRQSGDFGRVRQMVLAAGCATAFDDWLGTRENTLALLEQIRVEKA